MLEQLDRSFDQLLALTHGTFSHKTTLMIGQELVANLQYFHFKNFIHNQLKSTNVMLGAGVKQGKFYLVDYAAAARYKDIQTL